MAQNDGTMIVTYAALDSAAGDIKSQADKLDQSLGAIKAKIAEVSELWAGEAREAYNAAQAEWDKEARAIHTSLLQISRAVQDAAPAYQAGDKRAAANFM
ncbi:WXG100 family type VII secretion target [Streptomyces sp. ISL-98]|uniref:WXG100 family type VII secretion target n=1 Tax=unclassified Streptomyces TaxID=2593676 RepID=UPI001BED0BD4|nr:MULTISPECIES: WXG100 family type VII secretion target [unclassified Streptomyces]MBT2506950.1 WXG100 family type VII secretion target [Streptomyces sp. ISL-98]MBT2526852.1 WXG100 family type VII secretion target [Streptomyces sp. ISL-99]